jgi:MFS family permease
LLLLPFIAASLHIHLTEVGFLGTVVNSLRLVFALPAAYIATKYGGIRTLIVAMFLYGIGFLVIPFAPNYFWLIPLFLFIGIGFALFHPIAFALIAQWSKKETRGKSMGNFTAIGDVGRVGIATIITIIIATIGLHATVFVYAAIALLIASFIAFFFFSKNDHIHINETKVSPISLRTILANKAFIFASLASFLDSFSSTTIFLFLPFLLLQRGVDPAYLGAFTAVFFIGTFFGKTILGRFADRFGGAKVFIVSEFCMAVCIFILATATLFPLIIICSLILGMFTKGTVPILNTMLTESAESHGNYKKTFGLSAFIDGIATTIAPVFLGVISDTFGITSAFQTMALFAVLAIVPAFAFSLTKKQY